jgi:hypothetical protein
MARARGRTAPRRGDLVRVDWLDIREDPSGDPETAELARRTTFGLFWARRTDSGVRVLVTTTTVDEDHDLQSGYCIYPMSCVVKIRMVRRGAAPKR